MSSLFGSQASSAFNRPASLFGAATSSMPTATTTDGAKDFELIACGSWDNQVRVYEVRADGSTQGRAGQTLQAPVLDLSWNQEGTQIFIASADNKAYAWDLASNQIVEVGNMWDMRSAPTGKPQLDVQLGERSYCSDVVGEAILRQFSLKQIYPMCVVALANREVKTFNLTNGAELVRTIESPLKFQSRCISIFKNKATNQPYGYALGSTEGRVAIQYNEALNPKDNFTFKCHRSNELVNGYQEFCCRRKYSNLQDIFAVNDIAFHPVHNTLATVGSDGRYSYWDKDARTKLKTSDPAQTSITRCAFNATGDVFAYAQGYDWSKGHEYFNPQIKPRIFLHACAAEMAPKLKK